MRMHNKVLIIASVVLLSMVTPTWAPAIEPETAATPEYSWNLAVGDTLIWNMTLLDDSYYVKHVVADFNSTYTGNWWGEVLWTRQYKWNSSTHAWDFKDQGLKDDPQMFVAENQTWQMVAAAFMGYYNGFWADLPLGPGVGWFALPMGAVVNMTYQNWSMVNYLILPAGDPADLETTISGLHWTVKNISSSVVLCNYTWYADGHLEHGIYRDWTNDILFEGVFVEPPSVTLNTPWQNEEISAGDEINCTVAASGETSLQTIKYCWSSSETSPDWSTQGTVVSDPAKIPVPTGLEAIGYLHVQAIDVLGQETRTVFQFKSSGGISGFPVFLVGLATLAGVIFMTRRRFKRVQFG